MKFNLGVTNNNSYKLGYIVLTAPVFLQKEGWIELPAIGVNFT